MLTPKLLKKKTKKVKEWNLTTSQIASISRATPRIVSRQKIKSPGRKIDPKKISKLPINFPIRRLKHPHYFWKYYFCRPRYRVRKNQKNLTLTEWKRFICAVESLADTNMVLPDFQDFIQIHVDAMTTPAGIGWGAHNALNFLTWHREYLAKFEARLMTINPLVTIPYWNWIEDRAIPTELNNPADIANWGITRGNSFNGSLIATSADHANLLALTNFSAFSSTLEASPFHNRIHGLVGGTMVTASSPADPLFWLHHCFIDKLFADWQILHPSSYHPNPAQLLQPSPIITRTNAQVKSILSLRYVYQP